MRKNLIIAAIVLAIVLAIPVAIHHLDLLGFLKQLHGG